MESVKESKINYMSLKQLREKLDLTQDQVAEVLGTKRHRVSKMERGVEIPDWLFKAIALNRLLEKAGLSFNDLLLSLPDPEDCSKVKES
jgi:DNA-binding XRE family transcriptional regulator